MTMGYGSAIFIAVALVGVMSWVYMLRVQLAKRTGKSVLFLYTFDLVMLVGFMFFYLAWKENAPGWIYIVTAFLLCLLCVSYVVFPPNMATMVNMLFWTILMGIVAISYVLIAKKLELLQYPKDYLRSAYERELKKEQTSDVTRRDS